MSETPFHPLFQTLEKLSHCIQTHLSNFISGTPSHSSPTNEKPPFSITSSSKANLSNKDFTLRQQKGLVDEGISANPVTKVELGRATWTFLHTLAAQFPDNPTRQQKKDVKELMAILSRMYPCKECADHFKEVLRYNIPTPSNIPNPHSTPLPTQTPTKPVAVPQSIVVKSVGVTGKI